MLLRFVDQRIIAGVSLFSSALQIIASFIYVQRLIILLPGYVSLLARVLNVLVLVGRLPPGVTGVGCAGFRSAENQYFIVY